MVIIAKFVINIDYIRFNNISLIYERRNNLRWSRWIRTYLDCWRTIIISSGKYINHKISLLYLSINTQLDIIIFDYIKNFYY